MNVAVLTPKSPSRILNRGALSSAANDDSQETMAEKPNQGEKNEESDESNITVWLSSLGKYPTDSANFRDIKVNATVQAEIVKYGPCQPDRPFAKDDQGRSFQQAGIERTVFTVIGSYIR